MGGDGGDVNLSLNATAESMSMSLSLSLSMSLGVSIAIRFQFYFVLLLLLPLLLFLHGVCMALRRGHTHRTEFRVQSLEFILHRSHFIDHRPWLSS